MEIPLEIQERAQRLKFLRKMAGLSMKEFAQHCNLGLTTVNYWEQGYSSITERGIKKVTRAMREEGIECSTIWLLSGLGEQPKITDPSKLSKTNYFAIEPSLQSIQEEKSNLYLQDKIKEELKVFEASYKQGIGGRQSLPAGCFVLSDHDAHSGLHRELVIRFGVSVLS